MSQILTTDRILEGVRAKNLEAISWFIDFSFDAFDSIQRRKMGQMHLAYGLLKETVTAIMILYENTKVEVCSSYEDKDVFDVVVGCIYL